MQYSSLLEVTTDLPAFSAEHKEFYKSNHNLDITVEGVLEKNRGRAIALGIDESKIAESIAEICSNPEVDIVVEVMGVPDCIFVIVFLPITVAGRSISTRGSLAVPFTRLSNEPLMPGAITPPIKA